MLGAAEPGEPRPVPRGVPGGWLGLDLGVGGAVLQEESDHFGRSVWAEWIGVAAGRAAAEPGMGTCRIDQIGLGHHVARGTGCPAGP